MRMTEAGRALRIRLAIEADLPDLKKLMVLSIERLQSAFLSAEQIVASHTIMGLDSQLVRDGTYYAVEDDGRLAGCGGWSRRATLYGGDHSVSLRDPQLLDPKRDAARVRAMYTHPDCARRGIGRLVLATCEQAAWQEGFEAVELMGTASGQPLYLSCGYRILEAVMAEVDGVCVPLARMRKDLRQPGHEAPYRDRNQATR